MKTLKPGWAGHGSHRPGYVCFECDRQAEAAPETNAGRELAEFCAAIAPFGEPDHHVLSESMVEKITERIARVEAEARSSAFAEVADAVSRLTFEVARECDCHRGETRMTYEPDEHRAVVLAAIARLQEKSA